MIIKKLIIVMGMVFMITSTSGSFEHTIWDEETGYWTVEKDTDPFLPGKDTLHFYLPCNKTVADMETGGSRVGGVLEIKYTDKEARILIIFTAFLKNGDLKLRFDNEDNQDMAWDIEYGLEGDTLRFPAETENIKAFARKLMNHGTLALEFNTMWGIHRTTFDLYGLNEAIDPYLEEMEWTDLKDPQRTEHAVAHDGDSSSSCFIGAVLPNP